jgi:hypothetical protein
MASGIWCIENDHEVSWREIDMIVGKDAKYLVLITLTPDGKHA